MRINRALAVLALCLLGCGNQDTPDPFVGVIRGTVEASRVSDRGRSILVEHPGQPEGCADRSRVHLMDDTRIVLRYRAWTAGGLDDLTDGREVRVWTTGIELRSCPRQVFAVRIEVRDEGM